MKCSIPHCERVVFATGLCSPHYQAKRKYGDPLKVVQKQFHGLTLKERLERYIVKRDGCWSWLGGKDPNGYGRINYRGVPMTASRVSYLVHFGDIPEGMNVCHKCDNPECTNPDHLFLGTQAVNVADMHEKGRARKKGSKGEAHGMAVLTDGQVREIKQSSESVSALAKRFNVSRPTIHDIVTGKTWRHIP